jgi:preprotein translocase subunit YajC
VELLIFLVFGFALMWLLIVLPQRRRQSAQQAMLDAVKPGDYIVTAGGMYGTVTELGEDDLGLEVAPDVEVRIAKRAIAGIVTEKWSELRSASETEEEGRYPS